MRTQSIKAKLYIVIAFITMILLIAVLNYCLNRIVRSRELEYQNTIRLEKSFSDLISVETTSLYSPSSYAKLGNEYSAFQKRLTNGLPALDNDSVAQRMRYLDELFRINGESSSLYLEVRQNLIGLFDSVRYIHEHHIAYFKNLLRRGTATQDYDVGESFQRSPIASAHEVDIIKMAVGVQTSLFEIFQSFHDLQQDGDPALVEKQFSARIKTFYADVNTFEDYSLDAQDGLLVEELLFNGRTFEESFKNLVTIKTRKQAIIKKLKENKLTLLNILRFSIESISAKNQSIKRNIEALQVIALIIAVLMVVWIIHGGQRIIHEIKRTVQETERIQRDLSYQIRIDKNEFEEFRIVSQALNSMTKRINEHVAA
ncbi:MAG: hypothetical protein JSW39_08285, partial [Desulfobacterales bacterium]